MTVVIALVVHVAIIPWRLDLPLAVSWGLVLETRYNTFEGVHDG